LIRTLPALIHDEHDPEDVDTDGEDHAPDAWRYGLMTRPKPTLTPLELMDDVYREASIRAEHDAKENESSRPVMDHSIGTDHQTKCLRQRKTAAEIENAKPLRCGIEMMQIVWLREIALQLAGIKRPR
jgi:hypothetical protein